MEKIPAAVIGLGRIASLLEEDARREKPCTHAGAISANPDCALAAGADIDGERRRLFAEKWRVPVYADAAEMIRAHKPQILVIASHPDSHYHYCRLAAESLVPVIICEKPLADTLSSARKIAGLSRKSSLPGAAGRHGPVIITNHERRYSADYVKAREILAAEKLGAMLSVRAVLYMGKNKRLIDVFWHDGTHLVDALMFLSGSSLKHRRRLGANLKRSSGTAWLEGQLEPLDWKPPESASGVKRPGQVPVIMEIGAGRDHCVPSDRFDPAPVLVIIEIGAGRDHLVFEMEFSCERGRLRIGNGVFELWESGESPYAEKFRSLKKTEEKFEGPTGYFAGMVADAVACAREPGREPISSAADGLKVIEYLHSVKAWR